MVKNFEDMFIRFDRIHERDRWTQRHHMTALALHHAAKIRLTTKAICIIILTPSE